MATDGHRLALVTAPREAKGTEEDRPILPKKTLGELGRLLLEGDGDVTFERGENHLFFQVGGRLLISRMIDGQFPAYERVIPKGNDKHIEFERDRLTNAVRRVALLSNERSRAVKFQVEKGKVDVTSSSPDLGEAHETLSVDYSGGSMQICFNAQYVLDFLVGGVIGRGLARFEGRGQPGRDEAGGRRGLRLHVRDHADASLMEHTDPTQDTQHTPPPSEEVEAGRNGQGPANSASGDYGADKIKVLEGLEAVRKRPAMYIGSTGPAGLHHLVYEVVDNSIDEALAGYCDQVNVTIHIDGSVTVADNGRGIPVGQHASGKSAAEVVLTVLHAGGKFDNDSYKVSGGLHGVGISVVNALSETLDLEIWREGQVYHQTYERGHASSELEVTGTTKRRGTKVTFKPDTEIFETTVFSFDTLAQRLRELAFLNGGVTITLDDERDSKSHKFHYEGGIVSFVTHLNKNKTAVNEKPIYMKGEKDGIEAEIALQWNDGYAEMVYSFANNINTHEGGTHLSGFRSALTRTMNLYATKNTLAKDLKESITGDDIREGLTAVISVKIPRPQFEGQTKTKLGNTEVKGIVEAILNERLGGTSKRTPASPSASSARLSTRLAPARRRARPAISCGGRAPSMAARCRENSLTARSATLPSASSTSSRGSPPAARPSRAAIGASRRSCR